MMRRIVLVATAWAFALAALPAGDVHAVDPPRGVQFSGDGQLTFVNKDVNDERFAIIREPDGTVTGNVFFEDCRRPKFIVCTPTATENEFSCSVATACETQPCGFADAFSIDVTLPGDFFDVPSEPPGDEGDDEPAETLTCPTSSRAIQFSDDDQRTFVNKDVEGQRYAITQFTDDDTVTGNVFVGADVPPKFIVCAALGDPTEHRFQCEVSDPCPPPPTACTFGGFSTEVTLPADFFVLDEVTTQTTNAFGTTDAVTDVLRIGVGAIPSAAADAAYTSTDPAVLECPGGGSVDVDDGVIVYDECRIGSLRCSGRGTVADGAFAATLTCTDLDRDRNFSLTVSLELTSTRSGEAMTGAVRTTQVDGPGFSMDFEGVSVADAAAGGAQFGLARVSNVRTYFPGQFSDFAFPFDGSEIVIVTAFIPSPPGFIQQDFELNLTTGALTPVENSDL